MNSLDFYINTVVAILGVAYPLLLQVIARLDEKYSSDKLVELFNKEWESTAFPYALYSALFFIFIWTLNLPPLIQINGLNFIIENSASILVIVSTILLIVFFFFLIRKVLIYYRFTRLIRYLIERHNEE